MILPDDNRAALLRQLLAEAPTTIADNVLRWRRWHPAVRDWDFTDVLAEMRKASAQRVRRLLGSERSS